MARCRTHRLQLPRPPRGTARVRTVWQLARGPAAALILDGAHAWTIRYAGGSDRRRCRALASWYDASIAGPEILVPVGGAIVARNGAEDAARWPPTHPPDQLGVVPSCACVAEQLGPDHRLAPVSATPAASA